MCVSLVLVISHILNLRVSGDTSFPLASPTQHPFHRWADCFILAVRAAQPAAGAPHAFFQLAHYPSHVIVSRLCFFDECYPTNPLVARKRCETFP